MNTIEVTNVEYIRPNRTIETIVLGRGSRQKTVFVYNDKGLHFRVFKNLSDAQKVADSEEAAEPLAEFDQEEPLDTFLTSTPLP